MLLIRKQTCPDLLMRTRDKLAFSVRNDFVRVVPRQVSDQRFNQVGSLDSLSRNCTSKTYLLWHSIVDHRAFLFMLALLSQTGEVAGETWEPVVTYPLLVEYLQQGGFGPRAQVLLFEWCSGGEGQSKGRLWPLRVHAIVP